MDKDSVNNCIETTDLSIGYLHGVMRNVLLEGLNLMLRPGELVCFMGPNGIGKSTLIRTLAGLQKCLSGQIKYAADGGGVPSDLPQHVAVVLTDRVTAANMTVLEVVSFGRYPYLSWDVKLSSGDKAIINSTLSEFRIDHLRNKKILELSDGQLQMVMIARAVAQDTPVILLDEPTAHLDLNNRLEIMNLLRKLAHQSRKAILVSTHELDLALQTADLIWLAGHDKKIISGIPEDLVLNGAFDSIFQFKGFDLKTGKVKHEPHRGMVINLAGSGHGYLWTKNALERNGFIIDGKGASHRVSVTGNDDALMWTVDGQAAFRSLEALINYFA